MVFARAERVFIVEHYFASKSFQATQNAFVNAYPDIPPPNKASIHHLVKKFRSTGSVLNAKREKPRTVLTPEKLNEINAMFETSPTISRNAIPTIFVKL